MQAVHRSKKARDAATEKRKEAAKERIRLRDERAAMTMQAHERARQARIEVRMKQSRAQAQAAAAATQGASSKGNPNWREQSTSEVNRLIQQNAEAWRKAESERINAEIARRAEERVKQAEARSKERKAQLAEQRSAEAQHINEQVSTRVARRGSLSEQHRSIAPSAHDMTARLIYTSMVQISPPQDRDWRDWLLLRVQPHRVW